MNANAGTLGVHDAGGATDFGSGLSLEGALDKAKQALLHWEIEVCAIAVLMLLCKKEQWAQSPRSTGPVTGTAIEMQPRTGPAAGD